MPRVSVVIPVFNVERYLDECLDSLEAQEVWDFEAILIDDGSTDASGAIAERRAALDRRLRVVHRRNGGLGSARNLGAGLAQGEFLAFLDSDDKLPPCAFSRLLRTLDRTGSDLASGNVHRFDGGGTWPAAFLARAKKKSIREDVPPSWARRRASSCCRAGAPTSRACAGCCRTGWRRTSSGGAPSGTRTASASPRAATTRTSP